MRFGGMISLVVVCALATLPSSAMAGPTAARSTTDVHPAASGAAWPGTDDPTRRQRFSRLLHEPARGRHAVHLLGDDLAEAATRNDVTAAKLVRVLTKDPTAWLDTSGRLYYVDPAPSRTPTSAASEPAATAPYSQTFVLHSKPWAKRTIFLDFDGTDVSNTSWNSSTGLPAGTYGGFSTNGDYSTFSTSEQDAVQDVWARVSEDYAPFEVDVTTQDPGAAGCGAARARTSRTACAP